MSDELKNKIIEKIKSGQAKMRPRWHFILKTLLLTIGVFIGTLALLYLASFVLFILRQTGAWFLPSFGFRGIGIFLTSLPLILILAAVVFAILLEVLVRHYSFGWRKPLLYSLFGIIVFVFLASLIVYKTSFHEKLFLRAKTGNLPFAGSFYREFGMPKGEIAHVGIITKMIEEGFNMETPHQEILMVIVTPKTVFPAGTDLQIDDRVLVIGQRSDKTIDAEGIRRIDDMMSGKTMRMRIPRQNGWFFPSPMMK